ncbi:hypothetical protein ASPWEDRAFT_40472 [Aspergillus wentii DTO 134E9]|uniref:Thioesterase domain-containing protein n=1 Tax=Aspergillus wentii DTO 134E9 TaxID=1073089 RepID=A0A1L9RK21_ASPWE|nr:uncharacterized protein ASPWEDRAFT_40472 [Aspergillus wentii DTO 134E9]KAI9923581.1 hypothetical protein MW887_008503 [Aspergillus wentii]OJJ35282.1 hypothetical protein ASPWEDRAFT_40472 [Aspergillus wentii DTO 134E9]
MASMSIPLRVDNIHELLSSLSMLVSWKTLALFLTIINIKNLPLFWHFRVLYYFVTNLRWRASDPLFPKGTPIACIKGKPTHPVFVPYGITSRAPILETDYNFHKSNSTYFSDIDISRTALVSRLYTPGLAIISKEVDKELAEAALKEGRKPPGKKSIYVALGSVYCSFKREIKPFELFEIQSKVIAWDQKWVFILTFFLRPAAKKGGEKTLLATALSKYVVKKGRLSVQPERVLRASGFLPPRPDGSSAPVNGGPDSTDGSGVGTPANGDGITAGAGGVDGSLVREVLKMDDEDMPEQGSLDAQKKANSDSWNEGGWTWERIEQERLRGIEVVEGYSGLDAKLHDEWQ